MKLLLITFLISSLIATAGNAQADKRKKEYNLNKTSLALEGYDPVTYFTKSKPVEGNKNISLVQEGITYYFSSLQNKQMFAANPASYEPQYGGWCAYAMGDNGEKVEVDPGTYKILNGKLYLFYNKYFTNTLKSWNKAEASLKAKADANWSKIYK